MPAHQRIFILDDDDDFRADLGEFLSHADYDVTSAGDPRAVTMDQLCDCDVLILDLSMPGDDGAAVLRRLSECAHPPDVLVMSGADNSVIDAVTGAGRLRHLPIRGSLHKPFDPDDLLQLLASAPAATNARAAAPQVADAAVATALRAALTAAAQPGAEPFPMMFQPQVRASDLCFEGAEALLSNVLPGIGTVSPERVVAAATSEPGLLDALTRETFRAAVLGCRHWMDSGYHGSVSVNIPVGALLPARAVAELAEIARTAGVPTSTIVCELTEDAMYASSSESLMAVAQMRIAGFGVALDDIGQRSSGLLQVTKLPVTELKIDRELIFEARTSDKARSIVTSLADLGRNLSMKVVAEGVETADDLAFIRASHIDCVQGYLVSPKLPLSVLMVWLASHRSTTASPDGAKETA